MKTSAERKLAAERFVSEWSGRGQEKADDETFWNQFLQEVCGVDRIHHFIDYQKEVKVGKTKRWIDAYISSSKVLIEQKSIDKALDKPGSQSGSDEDITPYEQAMRYANHLPQQESPAYIVTCNFAEFWIYDRNNDPNGEAPIKVKLEELPEQFNLFDFIIRPQQDALTKQKTVNLEAARLIGELYTLIAKQYNDIDNARHSIAVLMVRILFCLYAEDAGLFENNSFYDYLLHIPAGHGQFRSALIELFKTLDTSADKRDPYIGDALGSFPYVDGGLFEEDIEIPLFTDDIKLELLQKASHEFDWSQISPVIFGSIFESILSGDERRAGGMHYTSVENIHKVTDPLFLDDLRQRLNKAGTDKNKLRALQDEIASLAFLDPACGSGNFLTQTYLDLRELENDILIRLQGDTQRSFDFGEDSPIKVNVGQFYGIEINDFAVCVANTALWIADHQANQSTASIIYRAIVNLPLKKYDQIICANALRMDWNELLAAKNCSYIMGNPPFLGSSIRTAKQTADMDMVFVDEKKWGKCDYCVAWYRKASKYMSGTTIAAAFVSTNSICQGEQVEPTWKRLFSNGINISFAWHTFVWNSEATDQAHVHCVIVGFSYKDPLEHLLFDEGRITPVNHINGYLASAPDVFIQNRAQPVDSRPKIQQGNKPVDGGNLILTPEEASSLKLDAPQLMPYIKLYLGSREFINAKERYCLWLKNANPNVYSKVPEIRKRLKAVAAARLNSPTREFREYADYPTLFVQDRQPNIDFIAVPEVSSQRRRYIPIGFLDKETIVSNKIFFLPSDSMCIFGLLCSQFHNAWMRTIAGRLKSDYSYSPSVYNSFIFPDLRSEQRLHIETAAQVILETRKKYPDNSLADLYDPLTMPVDLLKAHKILDREVEKAYGVNFKGDEQKIVAHLFELYADTIKEGL